MREDAEGARWLQRGYVLYATGYIYTLPCIMYVGVGTRLVQAGTYMHW